MDPYVQLAKNTIEEYIQNRGIYQPKDAELTEEMKNGRAGVFVSIHKNGDLRGCIGTIEPVQRSIAKEIISNALAASTRDPRFPPVQKQELANLEINVDVLGEAEPVSSYAELDPERYGVIVEKGCRRGLLLPDLEGVDTVEDQVQIARHKAGIRDREEGVRMYRFEVIRHEADASQTPSMNKK